MKVFTQRLSLILSVLILSACGSSDGLDNAPPVGTTSGGSTGGTSGGGTSGGSSSGGATGPAGNWYKGDTHVHDDHSADGSFFRQVIGQGSPGNVSVADQIGQAEFNGADFIPLTDHRTYDQHYDPLWESSKVLLIRGEEANGSPHATVHGAVDTIVQGANSPGAPDFQRMQWSIWAAHAQDANWGTAHPDDGEMNDDGSPNADASAQGVDTIEIWNRASNPDTEIDYAEGRWNLGFRTGVAGASDDHFRELWPIDGPGIPVTSVFAANLGERAVIQALRAGRTSVRAKDLFGPVSPVGPDLTLEADLQLDNVYEAINGDEVVAPANTKGRLRITVRNGFGTVVSLYKSPGRSAGALQTFIPTSIANADVYTVDITTGDGPSWYRLEARGPGEFAAVPTAVLSDPINNLPTLVTSLLNELRAVTAPIFIGPSLVEASPEIALPGDAGTDDGARVSIGTVGNFAGFSDVAVANDRVHVVAETHSAGASHAAYQAMDSAGALVGRPIDLAASSGSARFPKIAARGNDVWVVWQDERDGEVPHRPAIFLRHSADGGATWQAEQPLRSPAGRAEHPVIALTADGHPVVAWQEISAGNPFDVMAQIVGVDATPMNLSISGKTIRAANAIDTRSAHYPASIWPSIAVAPNGDIAVAWQDDRTDKDPLWTGGSGYGKGTDPDNWQIDVAIRTINTLTWRAPSSIGADDLADRHPSIAYASDGSLLAAWDSKALQSSGTNLAVLASRSVDGGTTWSPPSAIAASTVGMSEYPHLGVDPDGSVRAVWHDSRSDDWRWRIMTAIAGKDGSWGAASTIPSKGVNTWAATQAGVIAWSSTRNARRLQRDPTQQIVVLTPTR